LAGTSLLLELAIRIHEYQQRQKQIDKNFQDLPYLIVFFDHEEPGALGSKTFVEYFRVEKIASNISFFINIDSIGYRGASPIIQTYPYEHQGISLFSPRWLVALMSQAAFVVNYEGLCIGHPDIFTSLIHQALRYHWISIRYLSDDGPFVWAGVPSLLFTDLEIFFEGNRDYHKITYQSRNLDVDILQQAGDILSVFIIATENIVFPEISKSKGLFWKIISKIWEKIRNNILLGLDHYLMFGPWTFGFVELLSLSLIMITVIYFTSFQELRKVNSNTYGITHRLLFLHLIFIIFALLMDTAFAFEILLISFPALICIHFQWFNIISGCICGIYCILFLYMDLNSMKVFGMRGNAIRELRLVFLILMYIIHSLSMFCYCCDYFLKKRKQSHLHPD